MPEGLFFIIGGIKGGSRIRETILSLSDKFQSPASVLYIGAAHKNDYSYEQGFLRGLEGAELRVNTLSLSSEDGDSNTVTDANKIESQFNRANIIFFDGGEVEVLRNVFDRYQLKDLCRKSFERGASVGGLCAGGSFLGSTVIHSGIEDDQLRVDNGAGLIQNTAITCYIGDRAQAQRLRMLENRSYNATEVGLGVPINQTITWSPDSGFQRMFPDTMGAVIYKP